MELRRYGQILRRRWAIALVAFLVTVGGTLALVLPQPWIYEAEGSLVVVPRPGLTDDDRIRADEALSGNPTIPGTFAQIAGSDFMERRAEERAGRDVTGLDVASTAVLDTNVITVAVTHGDPEVAYVMATALLAEMIDHATEEKGTFRLRSFDDPELPDEPVGPNKNLMIVAGLLLGAVLAMGLAILAEYLKRPDEELAIDDPVTGLRNELYLHERLHEELARTRRTAHTTAVCLVRVGVRTGDNDDVAHAPTPRDLRRIARGLQLTVGDDAVLASLAGGTFLVLLPDTPRSKADGLRDGWEAAIRALMDWASQGEIGPRLQITGGTGQIEGGRLVGSSEVEATLRPLSGPDLSPAESGEPTIVIPPAATRIGAPAEAEPAVVITEMPPVPAETAATAAPAAAEPAAVITEMPPVPAGTAAATARAETASTAPPATERPRTEPAPAALAQSGKAGVSGDGGGGAHRQGHRQGNGKRSRATPPAASTNGEGVAPAAGTSQDTTEPSQETADPDGGGGSSREDREETSRAGDRAG